MKVIVVTKKTAWTRMSEGEFGPISDAARRKMQAGHTQHAKTLEVVSETLAEARIRPFTVSADSIFDSDQADWVITVGGDGTLLSASHHINGITPVLAINSDPDNSVGNFCAADSSTARDFVRRAIRHENSMSEITRMEVRVAERSKGPHRTVTQRVLNEALFSHTCPAAMTRFSFRNEFYKSSGIWIGTGAGSTGAMRSAGGEQFAASSRWLQAIVRERYQDPLAAPSDAPKCTMSHENGTFVVKSLTDEATLYLDGPHMQVPIWYENRMIFRLGESLRLVV